MDRARTSPSRHIHRYRRRSATSRQPGLPSSAWRPRRLPAPNHPLCRATDPLPGFPCAYPITRLIRPSRAPARPVCPSAAPFRVGYTRFAYTDKYPIPTTQTTHKCSWVKTGANLRNQPGINLTRSLGKIVTHYTLGRQRQRAVGTQYS